MSSQTHNHPPSLVPGPSASAHRVDSQQDIKQALADEPPACVAYRPEFAPHLERARKNHHRNHRIVDAFIYAQSSAEGGIEVLDVLSDGAPVRDQAVAPQPLHRARPVASAQAVPVDAVSQAHHRARPETSIQVPSRSPLQPATSVRAPTNTKFIPPPSLQSYTIPRPPSHTPRAPRHHPSPSPTHATITVSTPAHVPALVHILSLHSSSPNHYVEIEGERLYKSPSRPDSLTSNGFIEGRQLDSNVAAHLLRHVENPRTKVELIKQQGRRQWYKML